MVVKYLESIEKFGRQYSGKNILLIGAGNNAIQFLNYGKWNIFKIVDSNIEKRGNILQGKNSEGEIISWGDLDEIKEEDVFDVIVITPDCYEDLLGKIEERYHSRDLCVYLYSYMYSLQWDHDRNQCSQMNYSITKGSKTLIPKKIHCFWFSGDPLTPGAQKCLDSWKKYCPDYEITIWNKNTYKTDNVFCNEALNNRQWAFASDYARCDVVYQYGGIYLDLDVELVKPLDDLLYDKGFFCFESADGGIDPGSGFGSVPLNEALFRIREKYKDIHFVNEDGSFNRVSILRQYTDVLEEYGLEKNGKYQTVEDMAVYPPSVMSPYSYRTGLISSDENTHGIHHWASAWISDEQRYYIEKKKKYMMDHENEVRKVIGG